MGRRAEKRALILNAAEEVMSEKGLADSSISEIARRAGVKDSIIYQHFKGKEDLLFSIACERMKDVLSLLREHLQAIQDAESRLRKWSGSTSTTMTPIRATHAFCFWNAAPVKTSLLRGLSAHKGVFLDSLRHSQAGGRRRGIPR